jgi:hypothetical protein
MEEVFATEHYKNAPISFALFVRLNWTSAPRSSVRMQQLENAERILINSDISEFWYNSPTQLRLKSDKNKTHFQ